MEAKEDSKKKDIKKEDSKKEDDKKEASTLDNINANILTAADKVIIKNIFMTNVSYHYIFNPFASRCKPVYTQNLPRYIHCE